MSTSTGRTPWIKPFEPRGPDLCPSFWRTRYIAGCPHHCAFCYLQGTMSRGAPKALTEAQWPAFHRQLITWMHETRCLACGGDKTHPGLGRADESCLRCLGTGGAMLNNGELHDSLNPAICSEFSRRMVDVFAEQDRHTLLLLTKGDERGGLPEWMATRDATRRVILSVSLPDVGIRSEHGGLDRIAPDWLNGEHLLAASRKGWRIRLRFDPLVDGGEITKMAAAIAVARFRPERITLGSLRFTHRTREMFHRGTELQRRLASRVTMQAEGSDLAGHPWRIPLEQRIAMYTAVLEAMQRRLDDEHRRMPPWGFCKETPEVWRHFTGAVPDYPSCNCTL